ncbi:MAG: CinA family protein [Burkholderiaceae bacterium]|nr:CinA family protein [Burkholderiaceae bacterium]
MDDMFILAAQVGSALKERGLLLATAESCTGGGVAQAITDVPGSSEWFDGGFVAYSNAAKTAMLDVPASQIALHGAVSEEIAALMAAGALANSNADIAVATTGIAGPGGAVPGKPVGTVCMAWVTGNRESTARMNFTGDRQAVRKQTVAHILRELLRLLPSVPARNGRQP